MRSGYFMRSVFACGAATVQLVILAAAPVALTAYPTYADEPVPVVQEVAHEVNPSASSADGVARESSTGELSADPESETARSGGDDGSSGTSVTVHVRAIRATEPIAEGEHSAAAPVTQSLDPGLEDISTKLRRLSFRRFQLISTQEQAVGLMKKQKIQLVDGNLLTVRPMYLQEDGRVGMWLRWQDGNGMKILDTRMHFGCGESMVTGMDGEQQNGIILAIDVHRRGNPH